MTEMDQRRIGSTELTVTTLGFGGACLGNLYQELSDHQAWETMDEAWRQGIRYFDTAPYYGYGLSEQRLARGLRKHPREQFALSTKVGRLLELRHAPIPDNDSFPGSLPFDVVYDYTFEGAMRSFEASLVRLELDHIDLLMIHDLDSVTHRELQPEKFDEAMAGALKALQRLREEGRIKAIGLGVNEWRPCMKAMDHAQFDCFMLAGRYTLLEQGALDQFLPACQAHGASVIIAGPFNSGILAGGNTYNYWQAEQSIVDRVHSIRSICEKHQTPLQAAALQFPLAHPSVACVSPGMRSPEQVQQNIEWMKTPIPDQLWADLKDKGLMHADAPTPKAERELVTT